MFKCVVFDFDDTIVKSNEIKHKVFREILQPYSIGESIINETLNVEGMSRNDIFKNLLPEVSLNTIERHVNDFEKKTINMISSLILNDFFIEISQSLIKKNTYKLL